MNDHDWRPLQPHERAVLNRMLELDFPGRDSYLAQLDNIRAQPCPMCHGAECATILLGPERGNGPLQALPVEGTFLDEDNLPWQVMLMHRAGVLTELTFWPVANQKQRRICAPELLELSRRE